MVTTSWEIAGGLRKANKLEICALLYEFNIKVKKCYY